MVAPASNVALQARPQRIPAGTLVTTPFPRTPTVSVRRARAKIAVIVVGWFIVRSQMSTPEQPPSQPANRELASGFGFKDAVVPSSRVASQLSGQVRLPGLIETLPLPPRDAMRTTSGRWGKWISQLVSWMSHQDPEWA